MGCCGSSPLVGKHVRAGLNVGTCSRKLRVLMTHSNPAGCAGKRLVVHVIGGSSSEVQEWGSPGTRFLVEDWQNTIIKASPPVRGVGRNEGQERCFGAIVAYFGGWRSKTFVRLARQPASRKRAQVCPPWRSLRALAASVLRVASLGTAAK